MSEKTEETKETVTPEITPNGGEDGPIQLPDDHPLVTTLAAQKEQIRELKERAQRLDELEQANLTEQEKAEARVKAAEERAAELEARNNIAEVALDYGLSKDDAQLLKGVSDIETMRQIAERLSEPKNNRNHYVPNEGTGTPPQPDERREFANFLVGRRA